MEIPGFAGKILYVDLTTGKSRTEPLDPQLIKDYLGGYAIQQKMAWELFPAHADPFSPDNPIIIGTGPFNGTMFPGSSELNVTFRHALNDAIGTACGGGQFALMLKTAGYDFVVISGRAEKPVYLKIGEEIEIGDARQIWGKDTFETVDAMRSRFEPCSVIPIGPAGEHLVRVSVSSIDQGGGSIGAGGLPAVMGSKNLKAIVAQMGSHGIKVADRLRLQKIVDGLIGRIMAYHRREEMMKYGAMTMTKAWISGSTGGGITRNWQEVLPGDPEAGDNMEAILQIHSRMRKKISCPTCHMCDKERVDVTEGKYAGMKTYNTAIFARGFKGKTADDYAKTLLYLDALDRMGICRHQFHGLAALSNYLYQEGIITKKDTGGLELTGDTGVYPELIRMIAHREGFGDVLADGLLGVAKKLGQGVDKMVVHVKGWSILDVGEPRLRGLGTMEFEQMVYPTRVHTFYGGMGTPAYGMEQPIDAYLKEAKRTGMPADAVKRCIGEKSFNVGRITRYGEDWHALCNCLGLCNRLYMGRFYDVRTQAEAYSAITGIEVTPADLVKARDRAWNMFKMLQVREGLGRKDDRPPEIWFTPMKGKDGEYPLMDYYKTTKLTREDVEKFLDDYYDERGWDKETGIPTPEKLRELGLDDWISALP